MTRQEASERYHIPLSILREYESWGLCGPDGYGDADLERLSTVLTLRDVGFTAEEIRAYMQLLGEPDSAQARLRMVEEQRGAMLEEIHAHERRLAQLDYLRHAIRKEQKE